MKGLIRNILREGDFDWVNDIPSVSLDGDWIIVWGGEGQYRDVQLYLFSQGLQWDSDSESTDVWGTSGRGGFFFNDTNTMSDIENAFDAYSWSKDSDISTMPQRIDDDYPTHTVYVWDDIKDIV